ncbi:hypothetical protein AC578_22 [Pseudocercospora eumusae]|uniref:Uncharacterized protein n=1 Tax=Pseudocercospora eumusae TaxID=321146 RepID=A0A139H4G3_9PEZI|nr:hypothetical protein AC578_22 [Pseudocercospora eumusae]
MFTQTSNRSNKLQRSITLYVSVETQQNPDLATTPKPPPRDLIPIPIKKAIKKLRTKAQSIKIVQRLQLAIRRRNARPEPANSECSHTPLLPKPHRQNLDSSFFSSEESSTTLPSPYELEPRPPRLRVMNFSPGDEQAALDSHFLFLDFDGGVYG